MLARIKLYDRLPHEKDCLYSVAHWSSVLLEFVPRELCICDSWQSIIVRGKSMKHDKQIEGVLKLHAQADGEDEYESRNGHGGFDEEDDEEEEVTLTSDDDDDKTLDEEEDDLDDEADDDEEEEEAEAKRPGTHSEEATMHAMPSTPVEPYEPPDHESAKPETNDTEPAVRNCAFEYRCKKGRGQEGSGQEGRRKESSGEKGRGQEGSGEESCGEEGGGEEGRGQESSGEEDHRQENFCEEVGACQEGSGEQDACRQERQGFQ